MLWEVTMLLLRTDHTLNRLTVDAPFLSQLCAAALCAIKALLGNPLEGFRAAASRDSPEQRRGGSTDRGHQFVSSKIARI
ncbi:hypothetical protein L596_023130 [Steinernema carpocapsae]|uniref:Uncharacterized protein n=1 Tax=Steinernema carpocapsae TaxID=34508 RepID=A0A4U5MDJ0_STECR|nr:hypothetical protein L596_023130 [Steinernema carpocapsae]